MEDGVTGDKYISRGFETQSDLQLLAVRSQFISKSRGKRPGKRLENHRYAAEKHIQK